MCCVVNLNPLLEILQIIEVIEFPQHLSLSTSSIHTFWRMRLFLSAASALIVKKEFLNYSHFCHVQFFSVNIVFFTSFLKTFSNYFLNERFSSTIIVALDASMSATFEQLAWWLSWYLLLNIELYRYFRNFFHHPWILKKCCYCLDIFICFCLRHVDLDRSFCSRHLHASAQSSGFLAKRVQRQILLNQYSVSHNFSFVRAADVGFGYCSSTKQIHFEECEGPSCVNGMINKTLEQ